MIAVEVLIGFLVSAVILVSVIRLGAPIADAFSNRLRLKFQELEPNEERQMKARIAFLEEEVRGLKQQVTSLQEATSFATKLLETNQAESCEKNKIKIASEKREQTS